MIRVRVVGAPERIIEAPGPVDVPRLEFWVKSCSGQGPNFSRRCWRFKIPLNGQNYKFSLSILAVIFF